jgi:hypothetical protein
VDPDVEEEKGLEKRKITTNRRPKRERAKLKKKK